MAFASNAGTKLNVEVYGSGTETVLLIPGLGLRAAGWRQVAELLAPSYRILVMEPRGTGESDTPDEEYTPELVASDVLAVLDAFDVDRARIVGYSMGGMIGQNFVLRHPERVQSLVLLSTFAAPDEWFKRLFEFRRDLVKTMGIREHFRIFMLFIFSPYSFRRMRDAVATLDSLMNENPPNEAAYLRQIDFCLEHDTREQLHALRTPTLVITGTLDMLTPMPLGQELASAIPGARFEGVELGSHGLLLESPEELASLCKAFFESS